MRITIGKRPIFTWMAASAGLVSWGVALLGLILVEICGPLVAACFPSKYDALTFVMTTMFQSVGVVILIHALGVTGTLILASWSIVRHRTVSRTILLGLAYYVLFPLAILCLLGLDELLASFALTQTLIAPPLVIGPVAFIAFLVVHTILAYRLVPVADDGEPRCRKCGYILRGLREPRCPECGEPI